MDGFWNGEGDLGAGFFDGLVAPSDIAVTIEVELPTLSVVCDMVAAVYVDVAVTIACPGPPDVSLEFLITAPPAVPTGLPGYCTDLDIILTTPYGLVRHIGAEAQKTTCARARKFGFETATWELPAYLVRRWYQELAPFTHVQIIQRGVTIFEGTITDPGISVGTTDAMRKVSCRGSADGMAENECVRAMFADSDTSNWRRPTKTPKHDFSADETSQATGDGQLVAQAKWGSTYSCDAWGDIVYYLYGGLPTQDKISGVYAEWAWKGDVDPNRVVTGKLPVYNLFADPRGMASANPWTRTKDANTQAMVIGSGTSSETIAMPKVTSEYIALDIDGPGAFGGADANAFLFSQTPASGGVGGSIKATNGSNLWGHKMALPDDLKKALAAGHTVPLSVLLWIWAWGAGDSLIADRQDGISVVKPEKARDAINHRALPKPLSDEYQSYLDRSGATPPSTGDAGYLYVYDKNGLVIETITIFEGLTDLSGSWVAYTMSIDALPAEAVSLELFVEWETLSPGATTGITREICFPCVSNLASAGEFYADGDSAGWVWSGTMNNSPSRQSDLTVTTEVFAEIMDGEGGPICVSMFASESAGVDLPAAPGGRVIGYPYDGELAFGIDYRWPGTVHGGGVASFEPGASQLGFAIWVEDCPYSLQFVAPATGSAPTPYGMVVDNITVFGAAGVGDMDGINVLDCIRYCLEHGMGMPAAQLDFPDASDLKGRQLSYPAATTWSDIVSKLDALFDWDYGYRENGIFYYYDSDRLAGDPRRIYCLPYSQFGADLDVQKDDLANGCEVTWTHADGITPGSTGIITKASPWIPPNLDGTMREKFFHVDAPGGVTSYSDALALAEAYLSQHSTPQVTGSLPLATQTVVDCNGTTHDVLSIREGDHIRLMDAPAEERAYGDLIIERVTHDLDTLQTTLEVGTNRKRLDRMLARIDAQVVRL